MKSDSSKAPPVLAPVCALLLLAAVPAPFADQGPLSILWTAPAILVAAMLIAWAAESAQFFVAQGFALAILAWLQTLPEFAVEAVLAWHQQASLLIANLTGALRLLTGLGWPMIYVTAAWACRKRNGKKLGRIQLHRAHSVEVVGLLVCLSYSGVIWWKGSLGLVDSAVLIAIYVAYLTLLSRMPPEEAEAIEDLEKIPRSIVQARRPVRIALISGLFLSGGALIYFTAEPFLGSLFAVSATLGIPNFIFVQWVAPFVSEAPEAISALYWARSVDRASMALMNMVSSNINQWTLLAAMLPIVFSLGQGAAAAIVFDPQQEQELIMTLGQSLVGALFLINMELAWWEAAMLFALWLIQFLFSLVMPGGSLNGYVTVTYFLWAAIEIVRLFFGKRQPLAFRYFGEMWREHVGKVR